MMTLKTLQLELTSLCNLRCPLCYSTTKSRDHLPSFFAYENLVTLLQAMDDEVETVNLYGKIGEPLLYGQIVAAIHLVRKTFPNARLRLSTNGTLLTDYLAKGLVASPLDTIFVALDGATKLSYKKYRRGGSFKTVCKNIKSFCRMKKLAKSKRPKLFVQFIPMAHNIGEIGQLLDLAHDLGANGVRIKICGSVSRSKKYDAGNSVEDAIAAAVEDSQWPLRDKVIREGYCQFDELYVDSAGNLFPCCHAAAENQLLIGNCLREEPHVWRDRLRMLKEDCQQSRPTVCRLKCGQIKNKKLFTVPFCKEEEK